MKASEILMRKSLTQDKLSNKSGHTKKKDLL